MAWTEELPSGKFRGVYRLPSGERRSAGTFPGTKAGKKAAMNAASSAEVDAASVGWRDPKAGLKVWSEWCEAWWSTRPVEPSTLTRDESRRDVHLMPKWGDVPLADITRHEIRAWAADLARVPLSAATVQRCVHLLSASLTAAVDAEIITYNPAYRLRLPGGQQAIERYLTRAEASLVLSKLPKTGIDRALVSTLLGCGLRWGEAVGLTVNRVDLERKMLRVAEVWDAKARRVKAYPKGRKIRDVPIPDWVAVELKPLLEDRFSGHVFEVNGAVPDHSNWRRRVWLVVLEKAKLETVRIHDMRHTYASWLIQAGIPLEEVGRLMGHMSPITTRRYAHLAETPREAVLDALSDPSAGRRGANVGQAPTERRSNPLRIVVDNTA